MNHTKSDQWFELAKQRIPGGVDSPVRAFSSVGQNPIFVDHAKGSHVFDVDGNDYIDFICSWGPMILGHAHPELTKQMQEVIEKGISYGLCAPQEVELAQLICEAYDGVDMVRMVNSGTEATMSAIRVARGYTNRDSILKFEGCYHGHHDAMLVKSGSGTLTFHTPTSPGVPEDVIKHTLVCVYNDIDSVKQCVREHPGEIACVIIEPIAGNMGVVPANKDFLQQLRTLCDEEGIVLIFDEVITGFRVAYGGAAQYYGVTPDMACFGKIIGAGLPVGAYGGSKELMQMVSPSGPIYQAGTLSGNPLAMHLGVRLLTYLKQHPEVYIELNQKGTYLKDGLHQVLQAVQVPHQIHQVGSLLTLFFTENPIQSFQDVQSMDEGMFQRYFQALFEQGILLAPSAYEAMFLSMAHTYEELDQCIEAVRTACKRRI